ncbi:MAG: oxygen-independent coproporphyrinogen III oxidase [Alphaproteobacteria bacterium]|nr:oxygen-independent coproporphyrinogen III oxidase [Alphaproteobacteria bacterium]
MAPDLIARYGMRQVPRYTSYPASPHFMGDVDAQTYGAWLEAMPQGATGSLYLHVPFCRQMCRYCGCHTFITRRDEPIAEMAALLRREMAMAADRLPHRLQVSSIHFGGGTPSLLPPAEFALLMAQMAERFDIDADAEIAIEIDPRTLTREMARTLGEGGVNRVSLGVQTLASHVQAAIDRVQPFGMIARAVEWLEGAGIGAINFDIMYGLPHQTEADCIDTVRQVLALSPSRLAVFGYAHVPFFKRHQGYIDASALPGVMERHAQAERIEEELTGAGYVSIGLDHFARADDAMAIAHRDGTLRRNFQGYTTYRADVLLAFGASAIGKLPQGFIQNAVPLSDYGRAIGEGRFATQRGRALTHEDRLRARIIERLMCDRRIDLDGFAGKGEALALADRDALRELADDGLIAWQGSVIELKDRARPFLRNVACAFDAYLSASAGRHARAI